MEAGSWATFDGGSQPLRHRWNGGGRGASDRDVASPDTTAVCGGPFFQGGPKGPSGQGRRTAVVQPAGAAVAAVTCDPLTQAPHNWQAGSHSSIVFAGRSSGGFRPAAEIISGNRD